MLQQVCFWVSAISLFVVSVTMLARANDLRWRKGINWNVRLVGFVLAGVAPWGIVGHEVTAGEQPSLYEAVFRLGVMLVFMTTPYLPPFWKWISGIGNDGRVIDDRRRHSDRKANIDRHRDENP